jgi:membrane protease YdiL (CAAX protease family)
MVFAAHTAKSGPTPPEARRPWAELTVLLFYLFGFVFWGAWANLRGHSDFVLARGLTALLQGTEALYAPLLRLLHVPEAWREGLHSVHGMGTYPFLFLLAMGNRPGALGFRWPHAPRWTMWAWAALPVIEILSGNLRAASGFPTALLRAALPEELAFRAGLQTRLEILLGHPARALVLTSLLFAVMHLTRPEPNPAWALANCLGPKAIVGFGFGYLYYRTRSLWPSVFLHAAVDVTFFGG